jgi:hypothetical protein
MWPSADDANIAILRGKGKLLRDALTHPSPFADVDTGTLQKMARVGGVNPDDVRMLIQSAIAYVRSVEKALGRDPLKTMPWLEDL